MKIKSLELIEDQIINKDYFSPRRNLIHSASNTKGKTTYVRMLFFALGYKMPEPKGVKFNNIKTKIEFEEKNIDYVVTRDKNILTLKSKNRTMTYVLPMGHEDFLSYIFDYKKLSVLRNLLGIIYIDQEKGWTLLNRGVVVGRIKFSIEDLLAGLNNVDVNSLTERKLILENRKKKCEALLDLNKLKEEVFEENGEILISDIEKELNNNISLCNIKISEKKRSLNQINSVIEENKKFYDYIDSMNLSVQKDEVVIDVNRSNLVNAPQANDYLLARRNMIMFDIEKIKKEKSVFEAKLKQYQIDNSQDSLFEEEDNDRIISKQLAEFNINQTNVLELQEESRKQLKEINNELKNLVKLNNSYISRIYELVKKYSKQLNIEDKIGPDDDYIFTSDIKCLTGAVLTKMVIAFKVAFLKVIEEDMKTNLFMALDSPKAKELDDANLKLIENLISNELPNNQIFYASIYDLKCENKIEIVNRAIENR